MFYRYISENLCNYINSGEHAAGHTDFDYAKYLMKRQKKQRRFSGRKGFLHSTSDCSTMYVQRQQPTKILMRFEKGVQSY